jgi:ketosteroid isomerase-like protein
MRYFILATALDTDDVMVPINAFINSVDKGDMAGAAAAHVADPKIIDEFPPYHWSGPTAFADWGAAYGKDSAANKVTDGHLTMLTPTRTRIGEGHAYVVAPTDLTFKQDGKPMVEHGTITYALDKTASGWKIASWVWSW